jgi:hypothetical protein
MGMSGANSSLRTIRLGLLVLVVLAGVVFHHSGGAYITIRVLYFALVIGFVVFAATARRRRGRNPGQGSVGGSWGDINGSGATPNAGTTASGDSPTTDSSAQYNDPPAPTAG